LDLAFMKQAVFEIKRDSTLPIGRVLRLSQLDYPEWQGISFIQQELIVLLNEIRLRDSSGAVEDNDYPWIKTYDYEDKDGYSYIEEIVDWPVISKRMLTVLQSVLSFSFKATPITILEGVIPPYPENSDYVIIQLLDHLDIFDYEQSIYDPVNIDGTLTKLVLKEPPGGYPPLFRVATIPNRLFVSAAARAALEAADIKGLEFRYLENFAWSKPLHCEPFFLDYRDTPRENPRDLQLLDAYCPSYEEFKPLIAKTTEPISASLQLEMTTDFELLQQTDYPSNSEQWPIVSKRMLDVLLSVREFKYQTLSIALINRGFRRDPQTNEWIVANPDSTEQNHEYVILHLLEHIDVFDWERSEYEMHPKIDNWAKNLGQLVLKEPENGYPPIFRTSPIARKWFISAEAREALEVAGIKGLKFQRIQDFRISG
jgi:hypothetical protein